MKKINSFKKWFVGLSVALLGFILMPVAVNAIPYSGPNTPPSPVPAFNVYTGAPAPDSNESDFFKARVPSGTNDTTTPYVDPLNASCAPGQRIQMRVYVHNGASQFENNGGNGPSVAHGTKVQVSIPGNSATTFNSTAKISADNAATVTDGSTINCAGQAVKIKYVNGSAKSFSKGTGVISVSDSIVAGGAPIRSQSVPGDVWGCWDDTVYVLLDVVVEEVPVTAPQKLTCDLLSRFIQNGKTVRVEDVDFTASGGATFSNFSINWGDGTNSNNVTLPQSHTYSSDGTFTVTVNVNGTLNGQNVSVTSALCSVTVQPKKVTVCDQNTGKIIVVDEDQAGNFKPVGDVACKEVPTVIPDTGMGGILGLFASVTAGGALAHRFVWTRRNG